MNHSGLAMEDSDGMVEVTKVDILGEHGEPVQEIHGDQGIEVRIKYTAYRNIGKSNAIIRIYRADGLSCCLIRSQLDGFAMEILKGEGEYSVRIDPLQLMGGMYYAITWIMNADDSDGFAYGASEWFEVRNRIGGREAHAAVFEPNRTWSQGRNSTAMPADTLTKNENTDANSDTTTS